jgi:hypothetical protein
MHLNISKISLQRQLCIHEHISFIVGYVFVGFQIQGNF